MADFVATIKVNFELKGVSTSGPTPETTSGGAAGASSFNLDTIREDFAKLSVEVRTVAAALEQLRITASSGQAPGRAIGASPASTPGQASGISEDSSKIKEAAEGIKEHTAALNEEASASKVATEANKDRTEAVQKLSAEESTLAEIQEKASKATNEHAEAVNKAAQADKFAAEAARLRAVGLKQLEPKRDAGNLNLGGLVENVFTDLAKDPGIEKAAASVKSILKKSFELKNADPKSIADASDLEKVAGVEINRALKAIADGVDDSKLVSRVKSFIDNLRSNFNELDSRPLDKTRQIKPGAAEDIAQALAARQIVAASSRIDTALIALGKAIAEGADALKVDELKNAALGFAGQLKDIVADQARNALGPKSGGKEFFPTAEAQRFRVKEEISTGPGPIRLNPTQRGALAAVQTAVKNTGDSVLKGARSIFKALVDSGKGLDDFEANLRELLKFLGSPAAASIHKTTAEFSKLQDVVKVLGRIKTTPTGGINVPKGAADEETSALAAQVSIRAATNRLFAGGRRKGSTERVEFDTTDATGNVRKIRGELTRLGNNLDSVRIKARDTADNMFDRTSVRAALQRVATWGAAAGIVYGAANAFKTALGTLIDTESAIIGLAKVMDESNTNLDAFKAKATAAGVAIAQEFGQPISDVLQTLILFGQQGKNLTESISAARASALAANVTTLDQPAAASAITAATEQFGLDISQAETVVDKFNEVSNNAAVTETVLTEALKRAGLAARNAGVDFDSFNGIVAAISEQTRQTGSEIGTALRFIFSRLQTEEAQKGLGLVGISIREANGQVKGFLPILEELAHKFETLTKSQKTQVAISIAGTRRFNTLLALLNNFSRFQESTANSINSAGSAQEEQNKVMETAKFKVQQLKNSLSALSISFGGTLLSPIKIVTDTFRGFIDLVSSFPPVITTLLSSLALGSVAFARFGDNIAGLINFAPAVGGLGAAIGSSLTKGLDEEGIKNALGSKLELVKGTSPGTIAAKSVGDFGFGAAGIVGLSSAGKEASDFSKVMSNTSRVLVDNKGRVIENSAAFSKFGATIRGFGTKEVGAFGDKMGATTLGVGALNSGLAKFIGFLGKIATGTIGIFGLGTAFNFLDRVTASLPGRLGKVATGLATIGRFAAAGALIYGAIKGIQLLSSLLTRSGQEVAKALDPEIQKRQEALNAINNQRAALKSLSAERAKVAATSTSGEGLAKLTPRVQDEIDRKQFKSPFLQGRDLNKREQEAAQQVGLANPQLISSIDKLGNVVLNSADAFDRLADSAATAQSNLLAITRSKAIEALSTELKPETGAAKFVGDLTRGIPGSRSVLGLVGIDVENLGKTQADKFNEEREKFLGLIKDPRVSLAKGLNIELSSFDEGLANRLQKVADSFQEANDDIKVTVKAIQDEIAKLPADAGDRVFKRLLRPGSASRDFFSRRAEGAQLETGRKDISTADIVNQTVVQNKGAVKGAKASSLIGITAEETIANFRQSGIAAEALKVRDDIAASLENVSEGDIVLFPNVKGFPQQAVVEITESGRRIIKIAGDDLQIRARDLEDVFREAGVNSSEAFKLNPKDFKQEINRTLAEVNRTITGAARGILIQRDLDLGVNLSFDISSQQRVAFDDENLFGDIIVAEKDLQDFIKGFGATTKEGVEDIEAALGPDLVDRFRVFAEEVDRLKTIAKVKVEIEEAARSFEKAANTIRNSRIKDAIAELVPDAFSGAKGGVVAREFETPKLDFQLSGPEIFAKLTPEITKLGNELFRGRKAVKDFLVQLETGKQDRALFVRSFEIAGGKGGSRDPERLSVLADRAAKLIAGDAGVNKAQALAAATAVDMLHAQDKTNTLLQQILDKQIASPQVLGRELSRGADLLADAGEGQTNALIDRIKSLEKSTLESFDKADLENIVNKVGGKKVPDAQQVFRNNKQGDAVEALKAELINFFKESPTPQNLQVGSIGSFFSSIFGTADFKKEIPQDNIDAVSKNIEKIDKDISDALGKAIDNSGILDKLKLNSGEEIDISRQDILAIGKPFATGLKDLARLTKTGFERSALEGAADRIEKAVKTGDPDLIKIIDSAIRKIETVQKQAPTSKPGVQDSRTPRSTNEVEDFRARILKDTIVTNLKLQNSIEATVSAFLILGERVTTLGREIQDAVSGIADQLSIDQQLRQFTTPLFGALAGVQVPQTDLGKSRADLNARELTSLESQDLAVGLGDASIASEGLVGQLRRIKEEELNVQRIRASFGRDKNVKGVQEANEALRQLGSVSDLVEGQVSNARNTLSQFGESFKNIEAVNQLRVDIDNLFVSFKKQRDLEFDRTSIDTGLGGGPFAFTAPSFEQFQQGQAGDLTKFQRAIEDIAFKERAQLISPEEANTGRSRATFERDQELIAFAQQKENQGLQREVSQAEQVRGRLLDFSVSGGPGAGLARQLFDDLTSQLESAGDTVSGSFGRQQIRDPRTGQLKNIPASEVRQFKGISGLEQVQEAVQRLAKETTDKEGQDQASRITQPLLEVLNIVPGKLDAIVSSIEKTFAIDGENELAKGITQFNSGVLPDLTKVLSQLANGESSAQLTQTLSGLALAIEGIDPSVRGQIINTLPVVTPEGATTTSSILESVSAKGGDAEIIVSKILTGVNSVQDKIEGLSFPTGEVDLFGAEVVLATTALASFATGLAGAFVNKTGIPAVGGAEKFAAGGLISGPGGPRDDRVPIMASPGEFILNAATVNRMGLGSLNRLNQSHGAVGSNQQGALRFKDGGVVPGSDVDEAQEARDRIEQIDEYRHRIEKLNEEKAAIQQNILASGRGITDEDTASIGRISFKISSYEAAIAGIEEDRSKDAARFEELSSQGFKSIDQFEGPVRFESSRGKEGGGQFFVPEGAESNDLAVKRFIAAEQERRLELASLGGTDFGSTLANTPGFVGLSKGGNISFSAESIPGFIPTSEAAGLPTEKNAFRKELQTRSKFVSGLNTLKGDARSSLEQEFIALSSKQAADTSATGAINEFELARREIISLLSQNTNRVFTNLPPKIIQLARTLDSANGLLSGNVAEGERGSSTYNLLGLELSEDASDEQLQNDLLDLQASSRRPLIFWPPPNFRESPYAQDIRDTGGIVGVSPDRPYTPKLVGDFGIFTNDDREEQIQSYLDLDLFNQVPATLSALKEGKKFSSFVRREQLEFSNNIASFIEDNPKLRYLTPAGPLGAFALDAVFGEKWASRAAIGVQAPANIALGLAGQLGDIATSESGSLEAFAKSAATLGLFDAADALVAAPAQAVELGELEERLAKETRPEEKEKLRRQVHDLTSQMSTGVADGVAAFVGVGNIAQAKGRNIGRTPGEKVSPFKLSDVTKSGRATNRATNRAGQLSGPEARLALEATKESLKDISDTGPSAAQRRGLKYDEAALNKRVNIANKAEVVAREKARIQRVKIENRLRDQQSAKNFAAPEAIVKETGGSGTSIFDKKVPPTESVPTSPLTREAGKIGEFSKDSSTRKLARKAQEVAKAEEAAVRAEAAAEALQFTRAVELVKGGRPGGTKTKAIIGGGLGLAGAVAAFGGVSTLTGGAAIAVGALLPFISGIAKRAPGAFKSVGEFFRGKRETTATSIGELGTPKKGVGNIKGAPTSLARDLLEQFIDEDFTGATKDKKTVQSEDFVAQALDNLLNPKNNKVVVGNVSGVRLPKTPTELVKGEFNAKVFDPAATSAGKPGAGGVELSTDFTRAIAERDYLTSGARRERAARVREARERGKPEAARRHKELFDKFARDEEANRLASASPEIVRALDIERAFEARKLLAEEGGVSSRDNFIVDRRLAQDLIDIVTPEEINIFEAFQKNKFANERLIEENRIRRNAGIPERNIGSGAESVAANPGALRQAAAKKAVSIKQGPSSSIINDILSLLREDSNTQGDGELLTGSRKTLGGVKSSIVNEAVFAKTQNISPAAFSDLAFSKTENISSKFKSDLAALIEDRAFNKNKFATGGHIKGPGGPKSDIIPIMASAGEFVLNASAVDKIGLSNVTAMNKTGKVPKFQNGGLISKTFGTKSFREKFGSDSVDASSSLQDLRTGSQTVYVNKSTGEEVVATAFLADELAKKGFTEKVDPDLQILNAIGKGAVVYTNSRTGKSITASPLLANELKGKGFSPDPDKPFTDLLEKSLLINQDGSLSLVSKNRVSSFNLPDTPFEIGIKQRKKEVEQAGGTFSLTPDIRRDIKRTIDLQIEKKRSPLDFALDDLDESTFDKFARGGPLRGPGGSKSDQIPILASNGEFILSASAVNRIGIPALQALNGGGALANLQKFQDGGLVGGSASGGGVQVNVNSEEIANAITNAITAVLQETSVSLNAEGAADIIGTAIKAAFSNIVLPEVQVNTRDVTVDVNFPAAGVPLDVSALSNINLGQSLGADVINRLEAVEGTVSSTREDINSVLDNLSSDDSTDIKQGLETVKTDTSILAENIANLQTAFNLQKDDILNSIQFELNTRFNEDNTEINIDAQLNKELSVIKSNIGEIEGKLAIALRVASQALTQALVRT